MPNPNTIPYIRYQDIQIPDVSLRKQFINYMNTGQYTQALNLLTQNEQQLWGKAFVAKAINTITLGILDLESRYNDNVTLFLSNLAQQYFTAINNLKSRGTYISTQQYYVNNFVIYNQELYYCIEQPPVGTLPTDTTYWLYLGLRGLKGAPGLDVVMKYGWNNSTQYSLNDLVIYNNNVYVATQPNINVTPGSGDIWMLFFGIEPGHLYVGTTPPTTPINNIVWFQTEVDPLTYTGTDPLLGTFNRYNEELGDWEEMWPKVLYKMMVNYQEYQPSLAEIDIDIQTDEWSDSSYTFTYKNIQDDTVVNVLPSPTITDEQYDLYNTLSISIEGTNITLSTSSESAPSVNLPIRVLIQ